MVAVKTLWILWKSFSTNFSFSSNSSSSGSTGSSRGTDRNGNKDTKRIKYNRLRTLDKSESSYFPTTTTKSNSTNPFGKGFLMSKSSSTYDSRRYDANGNQTTQSWTKSTLDDSDSEYEDNDDFFMSTTPDDFSDFEEEDEALTCDVCDRSFSTVKRLAEHQQKKRHYGCLQCDSIFPSKQALDHHRQEMDHYDFVSDYDSETTSFESDEEPAETQEERERLL